MNDPVFDLMDFAARIGGGPDVTYHIPEDAQILFGHGHGHILAGATMAVWADQ